MQIATFHKGHLKALIESEPNMDDSCFRFLYEPIVREFRENKDYISYTHDTTKSVLPEETSWPIWRPIAFLYADEPLDYWTLPPSINQFWQTEDQHCRAPIGSRFTVKRLVWPDETQEWSIVKIADHPCLYPWRHEQHRYVQ